jgi:hypothetical protein
MKVISSYIITVISIFFVSSCSEKSTIPDTGTHTEAIGIVIYHNGSQYFRIKAAKIDSTIAKEFALKLNQALEFEVKFIDEDGEEIIPQESDKNFSWIIDDTTLVVMKLLPGEKWKFQAVGKKVGSTLIEFRLNHGDHPDFKTPKVPLVVNG